MGSGERRDGEEENVGKKGEQGITKKSRKNMSEENRVQRRENSFPLRMRGMKTKEEVPNGQRGGQNNKWNGLRGR